MDINTAIRFSVERVSLELFSPGSIFSIYSLATSFAVGVCALAYMRKKRRGRASARTIARAILAKRVWAHNSFHGDVKLTILSVVFMPAVIGGLVLSSGAVARAVDAMLTGAFGPMPPVGCCATLVRIVTTVVLFLAYEIGYYADHYMKHRIPFLWELHKVHHTADVLTPFTNFRNHPIDNVVFGYNLALFIGAASGALTWLFGGHVDMFAVGGKNILFLLFLWTIGHLQHSEFWIPFRGLWGRLLLSPAHHQIHHSKDPAHFNRNLGSVLAVWDWMFGTLEVPSQKNPRLAYGVEETGVDQHSSAGLLAAPVVKSLSALWRALVAVRDYFSQGSRAATDRAQ